MEEEPESVVLIIGTLDHEGLLSGIKASGRTYVIKRIDSLPKNWLSICRIFERKRISAVVVKLTGETYGLLVNERYQDVAPKLLKHIAASNNAVYVYEDVFRGREDESEEEVEDADIDFTDWSREDWGEYINSMDHSHFKYPSKPVRLRVNGMLLESGIEPIPYRTNADLSVLASTFIAEADGGLLFRIYVPADRLWANETDRLLTLFKDYLANLGHRTVSLDQKRTARGIIYEFRDSSDDTGEVGRTSLETQFGEFSQFLDSCLTDLPKAEGTLAALNVEPRKIQSILTRYAKEARRIRMDLGHERETKMLSIRQQLESEIGDELPPSVTLDTIGRLADSVVPKIAGLGSAITAATPQSLLINAADSAVVTLNLQPHHVNAVNAVVAREVSGNIHLGEEQQQLLQLIQEHAPAKQVELKSAVHEVTDLEVPRPARIRAVQRLKSFLVSLTGKVPDVAAGLLQAYLEGRLSL